MIKIAYSDRFVLELPEGHKFPMIKYELIREQLLYEGLITTDHLYDPGLVTEEIMRMTHSREYVDRLLSLQLTEKEIRRIGFPKSQKLIDRCRNSTAGTIQSALNALEVGVALNTAGGTHHAFSDRGEGFCLLNDIAVAANYLLYKHLATKILIVDLDVHQGNGTAEIFANNDKVFTFSVHGADNYPLKKEISDLDIPLKAYANDNDYLPLITTQLNLLIEKQQPDFIFYQAGVDILETDKLGKLSVSRYGCKQRDEIVLSTCANYQIPVAVSMGGGYSERIADIVEAHCNTFRVAFDIWG